MAATRQQINLYLPELRPRRDAVTAARILLTAGGVVLVMALLTALNFWQGYSLQQDLAAVSTELAAQTGRTEQIEGTLAGRATDQGLLSEIETRQTNLAQMEQTLSILRSSSLGNMSGFSEHMKNLSRASFEGIWLTDVRISEGGTKAYLSGKAQHSAMVPNFVDRLTSGWTRAEGWRFTRLTGALEPAGENSEPLYLFELETH